jgi:hypothetical protein
VFGFAGPHSDLTRLNCHRFRSNEVRLWLPIIASSLAKGGVTTDNRELVPDELPAAARDDGGTAGQTRTILLVPTWCGPSDEAPVCHHVGTDRWIAASVGIAEAAGTHESDFDVSQEWGGAWENGFWKPGDEF